jgi:hypothetical protein
MLRITPMFRDGPSLGLTPLHLSVVSVVLSPCARTDPVLGRYYIYNGSVLDSTYLLASLTEDDLSHPDVLHATQVCGSARSTQPGHV